MFGMRDLIPRSRGREVAPGRHGWEHPMLMLQRNMDRMFDDMWQSFNPPAFERTGRGEMVTPRVDVTETDDKILVTAELPGMEEKDVELLWNDNVLTIKGEKKVEHEEKERGYTYTERSYGTFERRIPIGSEVVNDKVDATFKNGVLTVTLPKTPETREHFKRIPIHGEVEGEGTEKEAA